MKTTVLMTFALLWLLAPLPHHQSELLEAALKQAGVPVTFYTVKGAGHGRFMDPKVPELTREFLAKHLRTGTQPLARPTPVQAITQGERIREYVVEGKVQGAWKPLASWTAVGHKKIDRFEPMEVTELRLRIPVSVGKPVIRRFAAFGE